MRLLADQNLSFRIPALIAAEFAGSAHVRDFDLDRAEDSRIWLLARERGFAIVSKDDDFYQRSMLLGHPPKVVWLRLGNCTTRRAAGCLLRWAGEIREFGDDPDQSLIVISDTGTMRF